jgi:pyruvate/2-oxoglutarate dehydrogenase complex dihydrolipoamide dehydrogenase (E3) component
LAETINPDLCVIGAGHGGLTAVAEARALGASVVLIERDKLGGDYLNTGAVPSAALAAAAAQAAAIRTSGTFGIVADEPRINTRRVHDYVEQVILGLAPRDAQARLEALGAQVLRGEARFIDGRTVAVGDTNIRARRFIIATGARSVVPPIPGLHDVPYFTSETIFDNTRKLTHLAVIGGGALALEIAQSHRRLGAEVTVIEPKAPLAGTDPELATVALERLAEEGVIVRAETDAVAIQARSQGIGVVVRSGDREEVLDVSHILVAQERVPNLDALDLGKARIKLAPDDPRRLQVGPGLRTTNRRVYAIGDAAGGPRYAHLAAWHAGIVVRSALLGLPLRADSSAVPAVISTDPEIATVGLSEAGARQQLGEKFTVVRTAFAENDRARATRKTYGLVKLIIGRSGTILGAGIVGDRAGDLVGLFAYAIAHGMPAKTLGGFVAPHPSLAALAHQLGAEYSRAQGVNPLMQRVASLVRLLP